MHVIATAGHIDHGTSTPGIEQPSAAVSLPVEYAERLPAGDPPVVGGVRQDRCLLDLRTIAPDDDPVVRDAVARCTS
jgi:L-seryl-tRNA(Ser) seleniumtransferase